MTVCQAGRLRRAIEEHVIVYNNFPWPEKLSAKQVDPIDKAAQGVLDARAKFADSSLADLYDPLTMPPP